MSRFRVSPDDMLRRKIGGKIERSSHKQQKDGCSGSSYEYPVPVTERKNPDPGPLPWASTPPAAPSPARDAFSPTPPWGTWDTRACPSGWTWKNRSSLSCSPTGSIPPAPMNPSGAFVRRFTTRSWKAWDKPWIFLETLIFSCAYYSI